MKKRLLILLIFPLVLMACSKEDALKKYVKEDIVLEYGDKVTLDTVINTKEIKDKKLLEDVSNASLAIEYKDTQLNEKIKDDKIIGSNKVVVSYNDDKKLDIDVNIKDSITPKITMQTQFISTDQNSSMSEDQIIKELGIKVVELGEYKLSVDNFEDIDFSKKGDNNLIISAIDQANNKTISNASLFIGVPAKSFEFKVTEQDKPRVLTLTLPSNITTNYNLTLMDKVVVKKNIYTQDIVISNEKRSATIQIRNQMPIGFPGLTATSYIKGNFKVSTFDKKMATIAKNNEISDYFIFVQAKGFNATQLQELADTIALNTIVQ